MTVFLFDLDGTLADSLPIILHTSRLALRECGKEVSDEQITALIGMPLLQTGELLLGPGMGEHYRACYQKHFYNIDTCKLSAFPGIADLLAKLKEGGAKLACVTSKRQKPAEATLAQIGLLQFFSALVCAESTTCHKPEAEPALTALAMLGATTEKAYFIGDSIFDIGCASNANIISCGVLWGAGEEQQLSEAGAAYIAHNVEELSAILLAAL
ncbi:MAG: HAD-IA family hydrolase [Firmicutes bacterium]|nr:HAD-IA family hydrolase [Bacillota bacterium]